MDDPRVEALRLVAECLPKMGDPDAGADDDLEVCLTWGVRAKVLAALSAPDAARPAAPLIDTRISDETRAQLKAIDDQTRRGAAAAGSIIVGADAARPAEPDVEALCERLEAYEPMTGDDAIALRMSWNLAVTDAHKAAAAIRRLSADLARVTGENARHLEGNVGLMDNWLAAEARLKDAVAALNQSRLAFAGMVSVQSAVDMLDANVALIDQPPPAPVVTDAMEDAVRILRRKAESYPEYTPARDAYNDAAYRVQTAIPMIEAALETRA